PKKPALGLTFSEKKRLELLPAQMQKLEIEINKLAELLEGPELFSKEPVKFRKASEMMAERQKTLAGVEEEWLALAERDAT
ncbi:MAG: ABC transporter ATP-binding protein, partial [Paracoccaceae bacterium]|nr:ABC transporter ATP-binding protein [Paracoccaceae bacterium]